jgi:hypothetical protein
MSNITWSSNIYITEGSWVEIGGGVEVENPSKEGSKVGMKEGRNKGMKVRYERTKDG